MKSVGIGRRTQSEIFNLLAAILHLGNLEFVDDDTRPQDPCEIKNSGNLVFVADLLGVSESDLSLALTYQTKLIKKEQCTVFLNAADAEVQRDEFAVTLFGLLFSWIIERLNSRMCRYISHYSNSKYRDDCHTFIGLVDFRGATFDKKSTFEDLLSNYALEKIQKFILDRITKDNVEELKKDKVLSNVLFSPFEPVVPDVEFIESLVHNIDEESIRYNSRSMLGESQDPSSIPGSRLFDHLTEQFSTHPAFHSTTMNKTKTFSVKHHFGTVEYDSANIITDNLDTLHPDFVSLCKGDTVKNIRESDDPLVRELFSEKLVSTRKHWRNSKIVVGASSPKKPSRKPSVKRKRRKDQDDGDEDLLLETSSTSFQGSLEMLLGTLEQTVTWYVYGLNPNDVGGDKFQNAFVGSQLDHYSIPSLVNARMSCNDYSVNMPVQEFLDRFGEIIYAVLHDSKDGGKRDDKVEMFCKASGWDASDYAVGHVSHSVFLAEGAYRALVDEMRESEARAKQDAKDMKLAAKSGLFSNDGIHSESEAEYSEYEASFVESDNDMMSVNNMRRRREESPRIEKFGDIELAKGVGGEFEADGEVVKKKTTKVRGAWVCFAWMITCCIPPFCLSKCGKMRRRDIQIAWREKVCGYLLISRLRYALLSFSCVRVYCSSSLCLDGLFVLSRLFRVRLSWQVETASKMYGVMHMAESIL